MHLIRLCIKYNGAPNKKIFWGRTMKMPPPSPLCPSPSIPLEILGVYWIIMESSCPSVWVLICQSLKLFLWHAAILKKLDEWQKLTMFTFCGFGWILGYTLIAKISYVKGICLDLIGCHDCKISFSNMTKKLSIIWSIQKLQQLG